MKKIYLFLNPVDTKERIMVYDKATNTTIEKKEFSFDALTPSLIFSFIEKYDIQDVEIVGPKSFTHRKKEELSEYGMTRYGYQRVNFYLN